MSEPLIDVLVPTRDRPAALAVTLACLVGQTEGRFRVIVSDQGDEPAESSGEVRAVVRLLRATGHPVAVHRHLPRLGLAEQRAFLLDLAAAPYVLSLDDDILLEPWLLETLVTTLEREGCGFVGSAPIGLSFVDDVRPHEQAVEFWDGPVQPEVIRPGGRAWVRHRLHNAANPWHVQQAMRLSPERARPYKVAWVGGCVLYDRAALRTCGGYDFWRELPAAHAGEDVVAELRVMARFGGCGILPSGAYHQELPTTVPEREVDAPFAIAQVLPDGATVGAAGNAPQLRPDRRVPSR
ncbi:MAG TPA: glycosyltransferase family A protein [Candidatus Limnocylindrales bacterium]